MRALGRQRKALVIFCALALGLYVYGVLSAGFVPRHVEGIVLPLDFMVGMPVLFYLLVVRPRKISLLSVVPVVWVGYGLSVLALGSADAGVLPWLLAALVPVEVAIAARECWKIAKVYRAAKEESEDPIAWFRATTRYLVRRDAPASMMAAELGVWHYALFSWRKVPYALPCETAFSYHNAGGYLNMMLGLALAFPVEIIGVHLLLSQWSVVAAFIATALSVYAAVWLAGDARARVMRPVVVGPHAVRLECGIQMEAVIPLSDIEEVVSAEGEPRGFAKAETLNYGTFYQANVWIIAKRPVEVRTMLGKKNVRAIGLSLDDPVAFKRWLDKRF